MAPFELGKMLPETTPADWGFKVSVCIALLCNTDKTIITVSDTKVDFGGYSADRLAVKEFPMGRNCSVLFAGNDVEHAAPILNRAFELSLELPNRVSPSQMADLVDQAYSEQLQREIAAKVLRKRGFDVNSFMEKGKQKCTSSAYLSLCSRIDAVNISLQFLVCGFDEHSKGHIFHVDGKSAPKNYDSVAMWAIGSGAYSAMSWLAFHADRRNFSRYEPVEKVAYFALTAKFMAETSGDIGRDTFTIIMENKKSTKYIDYEGANKIKLLWNSAGIPPVPKGAVEALGSVIIELDNEEDAKTP